MSNKVFVYVKGATIEERDKNTNNNKIIYEIDALKNKFELNRIYKDMKKSIKNLKIFDLLARNANRIVFVEKENELVHLTYKEFDGSFYINDSDYDILRNINIILTENNYLLIKYESVDTSILDNISNNSNLNSLPGKVIRKWCMQNRHKPECQYILDTYFTETKLNKFSYYNIIFKNGRIQIVRDLNKSPKFKDYGD